MEQRAVDLPLAFCRWKMQERQVKRERAYLISYENERFAPYFAAFCRQKSTERYEIASLHRFVNGSGNNVVLLFLRKFNEVYSITRNANGKLRIFFRMSLRVQKRFTVENVNVKVVAAVADVTV